MSPDRRRNRLVAIANVVEEKSLQMPLSIIGVITEFCLASAAGYVIGLRSRPELWRATGLSFVPGAAGAT